VALVISWGQILLWDVKTSKLRNCLKGHTGDIESIAFHPDGKILASTNRDGSISLWDLATGQERMVLTGHSGGANFVAFSSDGATMASGGDDGVVKLWQGPVSQEARAPKTEPDPLVVWPPPTADLDQWAEQLERRRRKVVDEPPEQAQQRRRQLAQKYLDLSQVFLNARRYPEAVEASSKVLELTPNAPVTLNNLAWLLATCADARFRDPKRAVELAKKGVELAPEDGNNWNTLGVANYRAEDWSAAVRALKKSNELLRGNGLSSNAFFLSMAEWQLGNKDEARKWYDQAVQWMEKNEPQNEELRRFRAEAAEMLKIEKQATSK
jgi:Flp pilus assembly protein TadD